MRSIFSRGPIVFTCDLFGLGNLSQLKIHSVHGVFSWVHKNPRSYSWIHGILRFMVMNFQRFADSYS